MPGDTPQTIAIESKIYMGEAAAQGCTQSMDVITEQEPEIYAAIHHASFNNTEVDSQVGHQQLNITSQNANYVDSPDDVTLDPEDINDINQQDSNVEYYVVTDTENNSGHSTDHTLPL